MTRLSEFEHDTRRLFLVDKQDIRSEQELELRRRVADWREYKAARERLKRRCWAAVAVVASLILMVIG